MSEPETEEKKSGTTKVLTAFAIGVLLSLGLCGVGSVTSSVQLSILGAVVFVLCLIGCVLSILVIIISNIVEHFSK